MLLTGLVPSICKAYFVITQHFVSENPKQWLPAANCALVTLSKIAAIPDGAAFFQDFTEGLLACLQKYVAYYDHHVSGSDTPEARAFSTTVKDAVLLLCTLIITTSNDPLRAFMYCVLSPILENTERPSSWVSESRWRDATQKCLEAATSLHAQQHPCLPALLSKLRIRAGESFI